MALLLFLSFQKQEDLLETKTTGKGSTMKDVSGRTVKVFFGIMDLRYFKILMIVLP